MTGIRVRKRVFFVAYTVLMLTVCTGLSAVDAPVERKLDDSWSGSLSVGAVKLRVVFHLKKNADGVFTGSMDSPDQSALGMKIDKVTQDKDSVVIELKKLGGVYEGKFGKDDKTIAGTWKQGGQSFPLELTRGADLKAPARPQEPKPPFPYDVTEVTYENVPGKATFAGTLTQPRTPGPHPAMLLITGSGSQNRDEEIFGHKPFLLLADFLTRRGIAVLRVDDRGIGGSKGEAATATTDDFVGDVLAGIEFLRSRADIDGRRIGLLGHSEGANIAVEVAAKPDRVSFIVLMATTSVPGDELLFKQSELISSTSGATADAIQRNRDLQAGLFAVAKSNQDQKTMEDAVAKFITEWKAKLPAEAAAAISDDTLKAEARRVLLPWFRRFLQQDPRPQLAQVRCPVLALFGERDLQVAPSQNRPPLEEAFRNSGLADFSVREFPKLNHLFQTCKTGLPGEYASIEETISPDVLNVIGDWVVTHSAK